MQNGRKAATKEQFKARLTKATARLHRAVEAMDSATENYTRLQEQAREAGLWEEICEENGWATDHTARDVCA